MNTIQKKLKDLSNDNYKQFQAKLIPNINKKTIIGVKLPLIKQYAKEIVNTSLAISFMHNLPHKYLEENLLHVFLINSIKDYDETIKELSSFLPSIDNWAVCDSLKPKSFKRHKERLYKDIKKWIKSKHVYTRRFAIDMLMVHFLDDDFTLECLDIVKKVKNDDYYIMMMCAWFYATALAKQYKDTLPYLQNYVLDKEVHNKTIQKAIESYRITPSQKETLKSLKIK